MILDALRRHLPDSNAWQDLCDSCYSQRYTSKGDHCTRLPAIAGGDGGIEGFTQSGMAYQCYYPAREYDDNKLHEHLRVKMTTDIEKFIDLKNIKRLLDFGMPVIHQWHFVIPEYRDTRIVAHAETKRQEVLKAKGNDIAGYHYIADDFHIFIVTAEDLRLEIFRHYRYDLEDMKLDLTTDHLPRPDWRECRADKVGNVRRKVLALRKQIDDEDTEAIIISYVQSYILGIELMTKVQTSIPELFEGLYALIQQCETEFRLKTLLEPNGNMALFKDIMDSFEGRLTRDFGRILSTASIMELKKDLIGKWLADCPLEFR